MNSCVARICKSSGSMRFARAYMARRQVQKLSRADRSVFGVARHGALERMAVSVGHAGNHDAVDALDVRSATSAAGASSMAVMNPSSDTATTTSRAQPLRQIDRLQIEVPHPDYTCIGNRSCRIIRPTSGGGRSAVQKASGKEWDQVWVGANIATMVAGTGPYGNIKDARSGRQGRAHRVDWPSRRGPGSRPRRRVCRFKTHKACGSPRD